MLTSDLAISYQRGNKINPRYVDADDTGLLQTAEDLLWIVTKHENCKRAALDKALNEYVGVGTDYRILRGMIKLLTDRCKFAVSAAKEPAEIRQALFFKAAERHPMNEALRYEAIAMVAEELECSAENVIEGLYADLPAQQKMSVFEPLAARELLDLYNLSQAQALLYRCTGMTLWVDPQEPIWARQLFAEIKRFRLIQAITGSPSTGYEITLSGPVSLFHRSQKYGIQMAVFLPALLLQQGWRMRAEITGKNNAPAFFELESRQTKLRSHYFAEDLTTENPQLEKLVNDWDDSEWDLQLTQEILDLGATAFAPDAVFIHTSGKRIYLELLGYWTPRYLNDKLQELARDNFADFLLLVSEEMRCSRDALTTTPSNVLLYKSALKWKDILRKLTELQ